MSEINTGSSVIEDINSEDNVSKESDLAVSSKKGGTESNDVLLEEAKNENNLLASKDDTALQHVEDKNTSNQTDLYAYLDRDEFTSEKFKIEVRELPKYYGISEMKKLLNEKLNLASVKLKVPRKGSRWAYVSFRNEYDKIRALEALNGYKWKGKILKANSAKPMPDPLAKKRKENLEDGPSNKNIKLDISQEELLKNNTIPYWNLSYEKQLENKQNDIKNIINQMGNKLAHENPDLQKWLEENKAKYNGVPCELWDMRHPEEINGYRNKCEFTIGMDLETGLPTVGFRLGSYVNGTISVGPVESLVHIPDRMKTAVKIFEKFVRASDLQIFNPENQSGHFKQLMARFASTSDELMLVVGVNPQDLSIERLETLKKDLVTFFMGEGKDANITSLYYQTIVKRKSGIQPPTPEHLWGDTHIHETLLGLKFSISPEAFFQINTKGAEMLYESAIELAKPTSSSTVVDICCGTGTIGLCFSKKCNQVLGLELVEKAIEDAKQNAIVNNIDNSDFFAGRAEDILSSVMHKATNEDIIAIVDPPRAGLHRRAIQQLRKTKNLNKLVYISCDPSAALQNFVDLGRAESKTLHGDPLVPVRAVPVDMFPHTKHCELLIYFERVKQIN